MVSGSWIARGADAGVWANAGAHESETSRIVESATVLMADGREERLSGGELGFGYRESRFKRPPGPDGVTPDSPPEVVLGATLRLDQGDPVAIQARLDDIRRWRQAHQPLGIASAGSVFRNPPGDSAGRHIDGAGMKGRRVGGASVSEKHANFIVNDRRGSAADVRRLADDVRAGIVALHGIDLAFEVEFLGDWEGWPWPAEEAQR
jgi:UDP-N-acetylmuramate dehydrogenase